MRRLTLFAFCFALLIALPAAAHNEDTPVWETADTAFSLNFFDWSPDGKWISYFTNDADEFGDGPAPTTADLHLRDLESGEECIFEDVALGRSYQGFGVYAWLPDHRFLSMTGGARIITPCTDESEDLSAAFPEPIYGINAISPDRTKVLFAADNAYYLYDLASREVDAVTGITPNNVDGSDTLWLDTGWSPDGSQITAVANSFGSIYLIDAETGESTLLLEVETPTETQFGEGFVPKGSYAKRPSVQLSFESEWFSPHWLTPELFWLRGARARGSMILSTSGEILMQDVEGGAAYIVSAVPSGDGYRVMWSDGGNQRYVYDSQTDESQPLTLDEWSGNFSPDGRLILVQDIPEGTYTVRQDYLIGVLSLSAPDRQVERRLVVNQRPESASWSPDSTQLAFALRTGVVIMEGDDLASQQWITLPSAHLVRLGGWSPDGTRLAVTVYDQEQQQNHLMIINPRNP